MVQALVRDCYQCNATIANDAMACPECGAMQYLDRRLPNRPVDAPSEAELRNMAPSAILQASIARYAGDGYRVIIQTAGSAQLVKPKRFSLLAFLLLTLMLGFPGLIYILYFWRKKDRTVYLWADENGRVHERKGKG